MPAPLIHIGYHKTASTFLQRRLFSDGQTGFRLAGGPGEMSQAFVTLNGFDFDPEQAAWRFAAALSGASKDGLVPVLSAERLSGMPHRGGYDSRAVADRLAASFPEARILVVIREQRDMLLSLYKTYVRMGGPATLEQYVLSSREVADRAALFRFDYLEYHRLVGHYQGLFGPDNVLVLPYELLVAAPRRFLVRVARFSGSPVEAKWAAAQVRAASVNVSPSPAAIRLRRHLNKWYVRGLYNPSPILPVSTHAGPARALDARIDRAVPKRFRLSGTSRWLRFVEQATEGRYEKSNAATQRLTGLDLGRFGYRL